MRRSGPPALARMADRARELICYDSADFIFKGHQQEGRGVGCGSGRKCRSEQSLGKRGSHRDRFRRNRRRLRHPSCDIIPMWYLLVAAILFLLSGALSAPKLQGLCPSLDYFAEITDLEMRVPRACGSDEEERPKNQQQICHRIRMDMSVERGTRIERRSRVDKRMNTRTRRRMRLRRKARLPSTQRSPTNRLSRE